MKDNHIEKHKIQSSLGLNCKHCSNRMDPALPFVGISLTSANPAAQLWSLQKRRFNPQNPTAQTYHRSRGERRSASSEKGKDASLHHGQNGWKVLLSLLLSFLSYKEAAKAR